MVKQSIIKFLSRLTSTRAAGLYLLIFAISIGAATFVENDFGTSSAQDLIFRSKWFELLLILFGATILVNIKRFNMIKQKKWSTLCFHLAIIIILIGAGLTRYFGSEGMMHIREGDTSNTFLSSENYLNFKVGLNGKTYSFDEPVYFSTLGKNEFKNSYQIGSNIIDVELKDFLPNPKEMMVPDNEGIPTIKVVVAGAQGREEYFVKQGDKVNINGVNFNFTGEVMNDAFNVRAKGDSLFFTAPATVSQMVMATQARDTLQGGIEHTLRLRSMYGLGNSNFVIGDYRPNGIVKIEAGEKKIKSESLMGLKLGVIINGKPNEVLVVGRKGQEGRPQSINFNEGQLKISFGAKEVKLPFSLKCRDFILEKYPGTDNPSSYASEVTLIDKANNVNREQRIYMNNILEYGGYRFFQSSFDQDEAGTYLSVNHDFWGTWISYLGYALLTIGLSLTFFSRGTRFTNLNKRLKELQSVGSIVILMLVFTTIAGASNETGIPTSHARKFGELVVQDHKGRFKPVSTLCNEVLRKLAKKESMYDQSAEQIILSMMNDPLKWEIMPLIKLGNVPEINKLFSTQNGFVSYASFFGADGQYLLKNQIRQAQSMNPRDQGTFEKAIIKLDEKVNIANMIFTGRMLRIFPQPNDETNTWISPEEILHMQDAMPYTDEAKQIFIDYINAVNAGIKSTDFSKANQVLNQISSYQTRYGGSVLPSSTKIQAELLLNKFNVFGNLRNYYGLLSMIILAMFFYSILKKGANRERLTKYAFSAMAVGFAFHTLGLALRWYVSGRAPWSNGYESMIYIGWTTVLAGTLFSRKSLGGLAATATLAATILMVASMSWLDPEISPLVPVLKSYWLTIHVSLEAGSYGFLMLGAVIGMLNLILMILINDKNKVHVTKAIKELSIISEITLLGGLFMVAIGTYLGGVWANESWGRYWGWDAKETWALVTILVYAFILHMRFIPGLQSVFAFSFASLFGFGTVIMTYLGVNYYLSGLHSYAAGDPVPIPPVVYYTTTALFILSIVAYWNYRKKMRGMRSGV